MNQDYFIDFKEVYIGVLSADEDFAREIIYETGAYTNREDALNEANSYASLVDYNRNPQVIIRQEYRHKSEIMPNWRKNICKHQFVKENGKNEIS